MSRLGLLGAANRIRRFNRITIGLWLGGITLGTGGCMVGASMPYPYLVAQVLSALWWGIYAASFGASIGALLGMFFNWTSARRHQASDGMGNLPSPPDVGIRACESVCAWRKRLARPDQRSQPRCLSAEAASKDAIKRELLK